MKHRNLALLAAAAAVAWAQSSLAVEPDYAYSTVVRLSDGKALACAVNEPLVQTAPPGAALTTAEQRQADVLATQRLRLLSGPTSGYPTPYTAPHVACVPSIDQSVAQAPVHTPPL